MQDLDNNKLMVLPNTSRVLADCVILTSQAGKGLSLTAIALGMLENDSWTDVLCILRN
jgi:hypothetical protein